MKIHTEHPITWAMEERQTCGVLTAQQKAAMVLTEVTRANCGKKTQHF